MERLTAALSSAMISDINKPETNAKDVNLVDALLLISDGMQQIAAQIGRAVDMLAEHKNDSTLP